MNPNRLVQSQLSCQLDDAPITEGQRIEPGPVKVKAGSWPQTR